MYPLLGEGSRVPGASWHPEQLTEPVWAPVVPVIKLGPQSTQCWEKLVGNFPRSWSDLIIHLPTASGTCADPESLPLDVEMSLLVWMEGDGGSSTDVGPSEFLLLDPSPPSQKMPARGQPVGSGG